MKRKKGFLSGLLVLALLPVLGANAFAEEAQEPENRAFTIRDVLLPQARGTILEMMSYFFVNCMMTISAVSFLATVDNKPIALMITQFEGQMQLECAAFVSLIILVVNVLMKYLVYIIKKRTDNN